MDKGKKIFKAVKILLFLGLMLGLLTMTQCEENIFASIKGKIYDYELEHVKKINIENKGVLGNNLSNINNRGYAVENGDYVYYLKDSMWLCRSDKDFNNEETIVKRQRGNGISHLNLVGDYLIYMQGDHIIRNKIDENKTTRVPIKNYMIDLHIIDNWVYFIRVSNTERGIYKMTINGEEHQQLSKEDTLDMAIYDDKIYFSYAVDETVFLKSMNLNGKEKSLLSNVKTRDMIVESEAIYYIDADDLKLYRLDLNNLETQVLVEDKISKFCKSDAWLYFSKFGSMTYDNSEGLYKIDEKGKALKLISDDTDIEGLSVIGKWLMYTSSNEKGGYPTLKRVSLISDEIIEMK